MAKPAQSAIDLKPADRSAIAWAQQTVTRYHYLYRPVDTRCSVEAYVVRLQLPWREWKPVGCLVFGRPEATRCYPWYGSVEDIATGRAMVTRWQVLNLARVWLDPRVQAGGAWCNPDYLPGFRDRKGIWRSTLASDVLRLAAQRIGFDYLVRRPPCFLDEPYAILWLLSYLDTRLHKGTIYQQAGFERYRVNRQGIETWRLPLPPLTANQDAQVRQASILSLRSQRYRAQRFMGEVQMNFWDMQKEQSTNG